MYYQFSLPVGLLKENTCNRKLVLQQLLYLVYMSVIVNSVYTYNTNVPTVGGWTNRTVILPYQHVYEGHARENKFDGQTYVTTLYITKRYITLNTVVSGITLKLIFTFIQKTELCHTRFHLTMDRRFSDYNSYMSLPNFASTRVSSMHVA